MNRLADYGKAPYPKQAELIKLLNAAKGFNLDIETDGLNFVRRHMVTIGVTVANKNFDIECWKYDWTFLAPYLKDRKIKKYIHNGLFDCSFIGWLLNDPFAVQNITDTMLNERVRLGIGGAGTGIPYELQKDKEIKAELYAKYSDSLKETLVRYGFPTLDKDLQTSFKWGVDLTAKQRTYMFSDTKWLAKLASQQENELRIENLQQVADLENEVLEVFIAMRVYGFAFDTGLWLSGVEQDEIEHAKIVAKLTKLSNGAVSNWNSPVQVKKFFAERGIMIESLKGIKSFKGKDKILDMFIDLRDGLQMNVTTFGRGWLTTDWNPKKASMGEHDEPTVGPDGRIHPDFNQIVATGRGSCSKPNLQNLPGYGPRRKSFKATKGYKLVAPDFTGQELAIMAKGSGEPTWLKEIARDNDIHSMTAAKYFFTEEWRRGTEKGCTFPKRCKCPAHDKIRGRAKRFNFGVPYGKKAPTIAEDLGISRYEANIMLKVFEQSQPRLAKWLEANGKYALENYASYTLPPIRRYRNLQLERESWHRRNQGYNTPIQGTGADMIKYAMILTHRYILEHNYPARIILWVHDELITEVPTAKAKQWAKILKGLMEDAAEYILGERLIKSDPKIMNYWEPKDDK